MANITITVAYRGAEAALDLAVQGHPVFSDEVSVEFDGLQALRLGIGFGQGASRAPCLVGAIRT